MEKNIVIIEDDDDIREGIRILLEGEEFIVTEAGNGSEGLKKINKDTNLVIFYDAWYVRNQGMRRNKKIFLRSYFIFNS